MCISATVQLMNSKSCFLLDFFFLICYVDLTVCWMSNFSNFCFCWTCLTNCLLNFESECLDPVYLLMYV